MKNGRFRSSWQSSEEIELQPLFEEENADEKCQHFREARQEMSQDNQGGLFWHFKHSVEGATTTLQLRFVMMIIVDGRHKRLVKLFLVLGKGQQAEMLSMLEN